MKKITAILMLFAITFIAPSCSNDDDSNNGTGELKLSGQVMSPNSSFPIARAKVKVFNGTQQIASVTSDAIGKFVVENLPEGNLTVELSKGKFKRTIEINLQSDYVLEPSNRNLDVFPTMVVVPGAYDDIEQILVDAGVVDDLGAPAFDIVMGGMGRMNQSAHGHDHNGSMARTSSFIEPNVAFTFNDLLHSPELLAGYDIVFLNCGATEQFVDDAVAVANLKEYIANGSVVYATDFMYTYLRAMFLTDNYLTFAWPDKGGDSLVADVEINDPDIVMWLENLGIEVTPTVQINGFLGGWQMVESFGPAVNDYMIAETVFYGDNMPYTDKALAFTFQHGCGGVFYSSFHTHGNNVSEATIAQMMNYFIFELTTIGNEDCGGETNN